MKKHFHMPGFTLIEALIYIALFSILIWGIVMSAYALFETSDRNGTKAELQEEESYLLSKIDWALTGVQTVTSPATNFSSGTLTLTKYDGTPVSMYLSSSKMYFATTSSAVRLSNSNVTISNLVFIHKQVSANSPESIEGGFTITTLTSNGQTISESASTTRYIRK